MKKILAVLLSSIISLSLAVAPIQAQATPVSVTRNVAYTQVERTTTYVYTTDTGSKYHKSGCRYLKKSCIKISLKEAKSQGLTPCKVCKPPKK